MVIGSCSVWLRPLDDPDHDLAQDNDREQAEALGHGACGDDATAESRTQSLAGEEADKQYGVEAPDNNAGVRGQEGADCDDDGRGEHHQHIAPRDCAEFRGVLEADGLPEPRHHGEERGVDECERLAVGARGVGREHGQQTQDADLDEDVRPGSAVVPAVQLQPQSAVDPGQPDQGEQDGELRHGGRRDLPGHRGRGLRDRRDVDQVVKQLDRANCPVADHIAMRPRRPPEPISKPVAGRHNGHFIRGA